MKVLWFANTACSATKKLGLPDFSGGWLSSLELELNKVQGIELGICFYVNEPIAPFVYNNTRFFPVTREGKQSKLSRYFSKLFNWSSAGDNKELQKLKVVLQQFGPDIVHIHGTEENFGLLMKDINCPAAISLQGVLTAYAPYYFKGVPLSVCKAYERFYDRLTFGTFRAKYALFLKKAERERKILISAKHVLGRTAWDKKQSTELAPNAQYYVANEILRNAFYNNTWHKQSFTGNLKLITTISDNLYKGFETIVDTCVYLRELGLSDFNWQVIGLNRNSETVQLIAAWKKIDNLPITFYGQKNENEIVELMLGADIYIQTSHIENSPNSLCEAMLLGMPIIASNAGGTESLADDTKEGILFSSGDYKSLGTAIMAMRSDFSGARTMAEAARARALQRHDKSTIVNNLVCTYQQIVGQKK